MTNFFISYTSIDRFWAEWIGFILEEEGLEVVLQSWDFRPGNNFVLEMQKASSEAARTIMVLSPDYLTSQFASSEWAAAFAQDPHGLEKKVVPVIVRDCQPMGLLKSIVHISLLNLDEDTARMKLVAGISGNRAKPTRRPLFPGVDKPATRKAFPGSLLTDENIGSSPVYLPKILRNASDLEKRHFIKRSFETISTHFKSGLIALGQSDAAIEHDYELNTTSEFTSEVFFRGKTVCRCRIWRGGLHSQNNISYAEGSTAQMENASNEILTLQESDNGLYLAALMAGTYTQIAKQFDTRHLTSEQAADYLWRRFVKPMER